MNTILGVPVMRNRHCRNCGGDITDDGYGDWIHSDSGQYKCDADSQDVASK